METPLEESGGSRTPRLLFLTARQEEHASCLDRFGFEEHLHLNHAYHRLETPDWDIRLTHTGIGPETTRKTLRTLQGVLEPDFIMVGGTAGSLSPDLGRGSLYLPTAVRHAESTTWFHPNTRVLQWIMGVLEASSLDSPTIRSGPLVTVDEPVTAPKDRKALKENHQALAVDMESSTVADHFTGSTGEDPSLGLIRTISDTPDDTEVETVKSLQSGAAELNGEVLSAIIGNLLDD